MSSPQVGVGVLIIQNGCVLLGKRKGAHGAGTWSAPGGHLEFGESIDSCARREVMEETGLVLQGIQHGPFTNNVFEADQKHYVTVFVLASPKGGEPKLMEPDKCEGWTWFEWDALPRPLFPPLNTLINQGYSPISAVNVASEQGMP
ncbi:MULTISPECIES: NUDIX hydrolase [unclassified Halomonas]|uniref:nucleotide triphosphate diphosphatase NUDT15 n=1 Tax=unclassified Halomonas TaxID=2609666 RepID=UPI00207678B4|nr:MULTISPECIES: NUDIX hydrolase [unclassified Halomonas]